MPTLDKLTHVVPLKHKRYTLKRRQMTIGIGVLASNGLVIAADSEISAPDDIKGIDTKIVAAVQHFNGGAKSIAIAGAGSVGYFQSLRLKVAHLVGEALGPDPKSDSRIEKRLERFMIEFHNKHVIPYAQFSEPPLVAVIVGTWMNGRGGIWSTDNASVRPAILGYDAIGVGATFALDLMHGYMEHGLPLTVESACLLACYVVLRVKATVRDTGKDTHMVALRDSGPCYIPRQIIVAAEQIFDRYIEIQRQPFYFVIGAQDEAQGSELNEVRSAFDAVRESIKMTRPAQPPPQL